MKKSSSFISFAFIFFVLFPGFLTAQIDSSIFRNYHPLISSGNIPAVFSQSAYEKYLLERQQVSSQQSRSSRLIEDNFYLYSNYFGDRLRFSGKVLVNDTIQKFVNAIADKLLADDPALRKKLHFYTLREPYLNAFTTDGGDIYINIGLISRVQNEAELAFVLAHEIVHFKKRHVLNGYLHTVNVSKEDGPVVDDDDHIVRAHNYAQSLELEADRLGFEMYVKAGYDPEYAATALELLGVADYPFLNEKIDISLFESPYFNIPDFYLLTPDTVLLPVPAKDEDLNSSHPRTIDRLYQLLDLEEKLVDRGKVANFYSADGFSYISTIAKFEEVSLLSDNNKYMAAAYSALGLLKKFQGNKYLEKEILRALFGYVMLNQHKGLKESEKDKEYCEGGEFGRFREFYTKSGMNGMNVAGLVYGMHLHKKYPGDEGIVMMMKGLYRELTAVAEINASYFRTAADTADVYFPKQNNYIYLSRDSSTFEVRNRIHDNFWKFAFIPYADDSLMKLLKKDAAAYSAAQLTNRKSKIDVVESAKTADNSLDTLHCGIQSLIVVSPDYYSIDVNNGEGFDVKGTMKKSAILDDAFLLADSALPMHIEIIAPGTIANDNANSLNLLMYSNDWISQKVFFDDEEIVPAYTDSLTAAAGRINAEHVSWTTMASYRRPREQKMMLLFAVFYIGAVRSVYFLVTPHCDTYFYSTLYNVKTGKKIVEVERYMPGQHDDKARIRQNVYDYLYQLNRK
jgi:Zn-dependent protease with chaperone function